MNLSAPNKTQHNLPGREDFIGREQSIAKVMKSLDRRTWLIAINGIGGVGKSSLALEVAHRLKETDKYAGIVWISAKSFFLTPRGIKGIVTKGPTLSFADDLMRAIISVAGLEEVPNETLESKDKRVKDFLASSSSPYLIIIDNLETVNDKGIESFLESLEDTKFNKIQVLATSRITTAMSGRLINLEELDREESVKLIQHEAEKMDMTFLTLATSLDKSKYEELLNELVTGCAGLPLAIKWTIARAKLTGASFQKILSELKNTEGDLLKYIFKTTYTSLSTDPRALLLSVPAFVNKIPKQFLLKIIREDSNLSKAIEELTHLYLIQPDPTTLTYKDERFIALPITKLYVRSLWSETPGTDREYLTLSTRYYEEFWSIFEEKGDASNLEDDFENSLFLLEWCFDTGQWNRVVELVGSLEKYVKQRGLLADRIHICTLGAKSASYMSDGKTVMKFSQSVGKVHKQMGEYEIAEKIFKESLEFYRAIGDKANEAESSMQVGICQEHRAEYSTKQISREIKLSNLNEALKQYRLSYGLFSEMNNKPREAQLLHLVGRVLRHLERYDESEKELLKALHLKSEMGRPVEIAITQHEIARLRHLQRRIQEAVDLYEKSISTLTQFGATKDVANAKWRYSQLLEEVGKPEEAKRLIQEANAAYRTQQRWAKYELSKKES